MGTAVDKSAQRVNGLDVGALKEIIGAVQDDPRKGKVSFRVRTGWQGQARSETRVDSYTLGGEEIKRSFSIPVDEPLELLGTNTAPNPQEILMAAMNACILAGYVAGCAVNDIDLEKLEIETSGDLDLRGFLGLDDKVKPGYDSIPYTIRVKGNGTREQFTEIHETVKKTSPNYFNLAKPVRIESALVIE